jgi:hypothetical protein
LASRFFSVPRQNKRQPAEEIASWLDCPCAILAGRRAEGNPMSDPNVSVSQTTLAQLEEMASWAGVSVADVLERMVKEQYDRQFWEAVNAGYAALRADPAAWAEVEAERRLWDNTLLDGLDPSERWTEEGGAPPSQVEQPSWVVCHWPLV